MRRIIFIFSIILLITACHHSSPEDIVLLNKANEIMEKQPYSALKMLKQIKNPNQLSTKDRAFYALLMSQALDKNAIDIESDSLIQIAAEYYTNKDDSKKAGYAYLYLSRCARNRQDAKKQAEALLHATPYAIACKDNKLLGYIYSDKALIYQNQSLIDSMLNYNKMALKAFQKSNDKRNSIVMMFEIGYGYFQKNHLDSAIYYYKKAEYETQFLGEGLLSSSIYRLLGLAYYEKADYALSLYYIRLSTKISDIYDYHKYILLARIYSKIGSLDSASIYLQKSKIISTSTDYYSVALDISEKRNNIPDALKRAKELISAKDSDFQRTLTTSFAGMEKKYNYERIAAENKTLIIANQRNKIAVLFLLLGLSGIIVIVLLWRYRHKQTQLRQHQLLVEKEKENNQLLQQQINMQNALIKNVEHHKKTAIKRLVPSNGSSSLSEEGSIDSMALYDELISSIDGLYNGFSKRLKNKYPLLTTTDILICCLLRAGFESGMIASVLDTQTDSFNVRRARLRKKLEIEHGVNFSDFLAEF